MIAMAEAYACWHEGNAAEAHELLRHAFALSRNANADCFLRWMVVGFRRMLAEALRADIDADYARSLIRKFDIAPESLDIDDWPWPIRVFTLGRFAIIIDDVPLRSVERRKRGHSTC